MSFQRKVLAVLSFAKRASLFAQPDVLRFTLKALPDNLNYTTKSAAQNKKYVREEKH